MEAYKKLDGHLRNAFNRSAKTKGVERHADNNAWEEQIIVAIPKLLKEMPAGAAGPGYQAMKKIIEAGRLYYTQGKQAALDELYDAIVYTAAIAEIISELPDTKRIEKDPEDWERAGAQVCRCASEGKFKHDAEMSFGIPKERTSGVVVS